MITEWTPKPTTVRVCGPWDGTESASIEFALFVGEENWSLTFFKSGRAEFWDDRRVEWCDIQTGQYLLERGPGRFRAVDEKELWELYEPATGKADRHREARAILAQNGLRTCGGTCALYDTCACKDADARHGNDAPALAEAIQRLTRPAVTVSLRPAVVMNCDISATRSGHPGVTP